MLKYWPEKRGLEGPPLGCEPGRIRCVVLQQSSNRRAADHYPDRVLATGGDPIAGQYGFRPFKLKL
jgi:hypothetical protein